MRSSSLCRVGMISSYPGLPFTDWLWNQAEGPRGLWKRIRMQALDPNPDYLLLYNYAPTEVVSPARASTAEPFHERIFRGVPRERRIFLHREPPLPELLEKTRRIYEWGKTHCGYSSGPDDDAATPDYMPAIWYLRQNFRELAELPVPPKPLACSWVTSTIQRCEGHRVRLAFLDQLRREVDFDLYGRGTDLERGGFGELSAKSHGLEPYRYTVVVENYWQNQWYVSEKLWDALLCWCLPLYYGGPAADRLMPEGSFLRIPSLDDAGIRFVKETIASPHHWQQALPKIREARERVLRELNLLNWLSNRIAG